MPAISKYPAVISVACEEDYTLSVVFDNGEIGLLDMKPYLDFGVFKKMGLIYQSAIPEGVSDSRPN